MTTMLGVLAMVLWATVACADISPMANFNLDEMKGKWYSLGIATNADWFTTHKADMKIGTVQMVPTADGDLQMTLAFLRENGACFEKSILAKKTATSGCFFHHCDRWESDNNICVTDAKFDEFAIMHVAKTKNGQPSVLTKLYGRTTDLSKDVEEKFKKFSLESGIEAENILILPPNGECGDK
ncbi:lipocalin-like [Brachyhypopomus gauderio]|uniref:lipocalin-like n=1 Tax=Brachyhypopomus gauderio TaxID=698409 RepID=UPI00404111BC